MARFRLAVVLPIAIAGVAVTACQVDAPPPAATPTSQAAPSGPPPVDPAKFLTQPLLKNIFTADPSAHVFDGKIFVYPSHDFEAGIPADDLGSHFGMRD